jgi:hypothetical protein
VTAAHIIAAFAPLPTVIVGQGLTREHAICFDTHRHACGLPAWLNQPPGTDVTVTAAQINQAVDWWNSWHKASGAQ